MTKPKLTIDLRGPDGNVFAVVARVCTALKKAGMAGEAAELREKALNQRSYEAVLELCQAYADVTYKR
jgi:hypothetical protein